ncbi:MAG: ABC transporter permease [Candidatus Aminicenantes bacterium]|nr:ABC transporter permease [Candidatus Aminicenantes bacterium]
MLKNFLIVALRNMKRTKIYSLVNIAGLTIGMAVCFLILLWVYEELRFDSFHAHADRIYRICTDLHAGTHLRTPMTMPELAKALVRDYPEVQNAVRIERPRRVPVRVEDELFFQEEVCFADSSLFEIFSFPLISGDNRRLLQEPYTVVLTEETALKIFKEKDVVGKVLEIEGKEYTVTGIAAEVPPHSHIRFKAVRSFETLYRERRADMENWLNIQYYAYLLLEDAKAAQRVEEKLPVTINTFMGETLDVMGGSIQFFLQSLTRIHLFSKLWGEMSVNGDIGLVRLFAGIAFFILCIACFNFINLTTARMSTRLPEIGIRKSLGSDRRLLVFQFIGESLLYAMVSFLLAHVFMTLAAPVFSSFIGGAFRPSFVKKTWIFAAFLGIALVVGALSGLYPAFYLSSFHPVRILQKGLERGKGHHHFRNMLVTFQFAVSIVLIIGAVIIYQQIRFLKTKNYGYDDNRVVVLPGARGLLQKASLESVRKEFLGVPGVDETAFSYLVPGRGVQKAIVYPEGFTESQPQTVARWEVDTHYLPLMDIKVVSGRPFNETRDSDKTEAVIINEMTARVFGWKEPLGKTFRVSVRGGQAEATAVVRVIGVVRDFHIASLHQKIEPLLIFNDTSRIGYISLKLASENLSRTLALIAEKWRVLEPDRPFEYFFLDDSFECFYRSEERMGRLSVAFSIVAVFLACLGLFSLSAFLTERRTKEIGIRKVLGASVPGIVRFLSKEFLLLALAANVLAWPAAYYGLVRWLNSFAYRIDIGFGPFVLAAVAAVLGAFFSVSLQTIRAARANPVDSLRYE